MRIYAYLRASTQEQDPNRAKNELIEFSNKMEINISAWFIDSDSGAKLNRPELFRLLEIANIGDAILVEQIDRISRLNTKDWETLKSIIHNKNLRIISLDLPTSHQLIKNTDEFTERILSAINTMMLDILAAVSRKDYTDRRRRQAQGVQKAKLENKYKGRPNNTVLQNKIEGFLKEGKSYNFIQDVLGCSRNTIAKVSKIIKANNS